MDGDKGKVCVTGGTGFVASWLIMTLLQNGYSVHTTVRPDPEHRRDLSFLTSLPGASNNLQIFEADMSHPDSFEAAIKGCVGVFHVATPVDFENKEPEHVLVNRTIEGTLGILRACLDAKTVKRVVYTSSASAVMVNDMAVDNMDESFWSDVDCIRSFDSYFNTYMICKTLTEKKVLEFAQQNGLDVVTVIPTFIVGPFICPKFPSSVHTALAMLLGEREQYGELLNTSMVHTDDVARAHLFLFEHPGAKGRYNCSSNALTIEEMAKLLSAKHPEYPVPTPDSLKDVIGRRSPTLSSQKLLNLGFEFKYGLDEMFDDAVQTCKEKGYL